MPDGYFHDDSMIRRVHREWAVALTGPRALLMMAVHPVAFQGFFMHTGSLEKPYDRLARTGEIMNTILWDTKEAADAAVAPVNRVHPRVKGVTREDAGIFPKGTPYTASDPDLLFWIIACLVDTAILGYGKYVRTLTRDEQDAYWRDYRVVATLFGIPEDFMPEDIEGFRAYMDEKLAGDELFLTDTARKLGKDIVFNPPLPRWSRPLVELVNQTNIGLLPPRIRRMYRLWWDPARALGVDVGATYLKRVVAPLLPTPLRVVPSARTRDAVPAAAAA